MSDASDRLRRLEADHAPDGWPAVKMRDITAVLDELEALREAHARLSAIYTERGQMVAAMRELLNRCS
jgi:hypothetical protein